MNKCINEKSSVRFCEGIQLNDNNRQSFLNTLDKDTAFAAGMQLVRQNDLDNAKAVFLYGADFLYCPYCSTYFGVFLADNIGDDFEMDSRGNVRRSSGIPIFLPSFYLIRGVAADYAPAVFAYGICLAQGKCERKDEAEALRMFKKAAQLGHDGAKKIVEEYERQHKPSWLCSIIHGLKSSIGGLICDIVDESIGNNMIN